MSRSFRLWATLCALPGLCAMPMAHANMGNTASTYGVLPSDIASAQALSLFNSQVSATYYNPAYLARDDRGELTVGLFHAEHSLEARSLGGPDPIQRSGGNVLNDDPSQQILVGMKTNLTSMTRYNKPLYLGFMAGVERFGKEMLAFDATTSRAGQFFNYGRQPLFLNLGGAMNAWRGIDLGASLRVTLHANANLDTYSNLAGETQYESLQVDAKPVVRPILGVNVNWGETLRPDQRSWLDGLETAFSYRGYSNTRTKVNANAIIPGVIASPGLQLAIATLDSFQPDIYALGVQYRFDRLRVGVTGELQRWSRLEKEFEHDTLRDQANLRFKDVVIPRIGASYALNEVFTLTTGLAFESSALKSDRSLDVNYLDNDRYVLGVGLSAEFKNAPVFAYPLRVDVGYQHHFLKDREFELTTSDPTVAGNPYERVRSGGDVDVFALSMTMKF